MTSDSMGLATRLVHEGTLRSQFGETSEALFLTSGFVYDSAEQAEATFTGEAEHYQYTRFGNPNLTMLQDRLAWLEGAEACRVTPTGMAAVHGALMADLRAGDRVVAARALFGSCHWIVSTLLPRLGIETEFVDGCDLEDWRRALSRPARTVLIETPSNPMLDVLDIAAIAELAHRAGARLVVDNVFATPLQQKPLSLGADVVVYSCTKHIDGQGRVLGGAVLGGRDWIEQSVQPFLRNTGATLSPFNAWVLLKGLETLGLRVAQATRSAGLIADRLAAHPMVAELRYPGRADHEQHALAARQMQGFGTLLSFTVRGGKSAAFATLNALKLIAISNNLGDSRSMVTHPATTTHMRIGADERARLGISDGAIRLSVGIEDAADLIADLDQALTRAAGTLGKDAA